MLQARPQRNKLMWHNFSATRIVAATVGVYGGLLGMEHGIGEMLQENSATGSILINAIGPQAKDVWQGREPALTLISNFFVTGVLAIIVSLIVILWAVACVQGKHGGLVLILLSILQFLVGGGLAPIPMIIIAGAVATRIHAPLTWWRTHLSTHLWHVLATLWPWSLIAFFFLGSVDLEIAVFGNNPNLLNALAPFLMGLLLLTIVAAFAHDIQRQSDSRQSPAMSG
jgi:membrane glycosyltransferase